MASGILTSAGLTAMLNAQIAGESFTPNVVQVSSEVWTLTGNETSLPNLVWTAPTSAVTQLSPSQNVFRTIVFMDSTIGNFTVGTIGLFTPDGILFALGAFPGAGEKIANSFPEVVGNIRSFYLDVVYADVSSIILSNLETITTNTLIETLNSGIITAGLFLSGIGAPSAIGAPGCMYLDIENNLLYGPLTAAGWGGGRKL